MNAKEEDQTQLEQMVYQIIQEVQADPNLQDLLPSFEPHVLLNRPIKHRNHMQAQQKAATLQAHLHMHAIWSYFSQPNQQHKPNTNEKNLLQPPLKCLYFIVWVLELYAQWS